MSPFVERLNKKGYEVLYLVEAVDEYCISSLPEFEGKKFQNVAKEGFTLEEDKKKLEDLQTRFQDLTKWLGDVALKDKVFLSFRFSFFQIRFFHLDICFHFDMLCVCKILITRSQWDGHLDLGKIRVDMYFIFLNKTNICKCLVLLK